MVQNNQSKLSKPKGQRVWCLFIDKDTSMYSGKYMTTIRETARARKRRSRFLDAAKKGEGEGTRENMWQTKERTSTIPSWEKNDKNFPCMIYVTFAQFLFLEKRLLTSNNLEFLLLICLCHVERTCQEIRFVGRVCWAQMRQVADFHSKLHT